MKRSLTSLALTLALSACAPQLGDDADVVSAQQASREDPRGAPAGICDTCSSISQRYSDAVSRGDEAGAGCDARREPGSCETATAAYAEARDLLRQFDARLCDAWLLGC